MQKSDFGARLRAIRKAKQVTGKQLALLLGMSQSKISKIESGSMRPSREFALNCAAALKMKVRERDQFIAFLDLFLAEFPTWMTEEEYSARACHGAFDKIEHSAKTVRSYQTAFVPWLLQTRAYVEAALRATGVVQSGRDRDFSLEAKEILARQRILNSKRKFIFLMTEGALKCKLAPSSTMHELYNHLGQMSERDNVRIGIIPSDSELRLISNTGFELYDDKLLRIETLTEVLNELDESKISHYRAVFDELLSVCQEGEEFTRILKEVSVKNLSELFPRPEFEDIATLLEESSPKNSEILRWRAFANSAVEATRKNEI